MPKGYKDIMLSDGTVMRVIINVGKRRSVSLRITEDSTPEVLIPYGYSIDKVTDFLNKNIDWLKQHKEQALEKRGLPKTYEDGEKIMLLGEPLTIRYAASDRYSDPVIKDGELRVAVSDYSAREQIIKSIDRFIAELSFREIDLCMKEMVSKTGLMPDKVTVKPMTASWGRCISNKHISINYKVIAFDRECISYVCLHELCHLVYMNHSKEFWALVSRYCPDYKQIQNRMK